METEGGKMAKKKVWNFSRSQTQLLQEQALIHERELQPLRAYQARSRNDLLKSFLEELGIPEESLLTVELDKLRFVERFEVPEDKK